MNAEVETTLFINADGSLRNESIEAIHLINRASEIGYARQHNLVPHTWIDIYFSGEYPVVVTGKITNIEEDQIEITSTDENAKPIYIDFAYKGIPKDIPIDRIEIRDPPSIEKKKEADAQDVIKESDVDSETEHKSQETKKEEDDIEKDILEEKKEEDDISLETPDGESIVDDNEYEEIEKELQDKILEADQIDIGEDLDEITQVVEVSDDKKKFSIKMQTEDILDDLLSSIPNNMRTPSVVNNIHKMIARYTEVREMYSDFDNYNNVIGFKRIGDRHKPLVNKLKNLSHPSFWILPIVKNKKRLYDIDRIEDDVDIEHLELSDIRTKETDIIDSYYQNDMTGENKYYSLVRELNDLYTPFTLPDVKEQLLTIQRVDSNITAVVQNIDNFKSSVVSDNVLNVKRFYTQKYITGKNTTFYNKTRTGQTDIESVKLTNNDNISIQSYLTLPRFSLLMSKLQLPTTDILTRSHLHKKYTPYWKILNDTTEINTRIIKDVEKQENNTEFMKHVTEHIISEDIDIDDKYDKFLNAMVPHTKDLIPTIKNNTMSGMSVTNYLEELEPYNIIFLTLHITII